MYHSTLGYRVIKKKTIEGTHLNFSKHLGLGQAVPRLGVGHVFQVGQDLLAPQAVLRYFA
jgi:hypothetical protein